MQRYTDLFVDFDDTLYDTHGNAVLSLAELFVIFGWEHHFSSLEKFTVPYWETNQLLWDQYAKGEIERDYLMVERFRRPLSLADLEPLDLSREYCLRVSDRFLDLCAVKPGVVDGAHEAVDYLKSRGYRMHICSNGFHEVQYRKLRSCGLFDKFDSIILSEDAGANKPSLQFFDYALRMTGAKRETTLMIGDNFTTDILGAKAAGLDVMFFNRKPNTNVASEPVNYEIQALAEIQKYL